jgi:hypothetical protein
MSSLVINTEQRVIELTLSSQQGPAGASTVAAEAAALSAQSSLLGSELAKTNAQAFRNQAQVFSQQSLAFSQDSAESAADSAMSASQSASSAASALATLGLVQDERDFIRDNYFPDHSFDTYLAARNAYVDKTKPIAVGDVVLILFDERFGGSRTYSRADVIEPTLLLDFNNNSFSTSDPLGFIAYAGLSLIDAPATSTSFGYLGAFAVSNTHLFVATGNNAWKRIALESF